MDSYAYSTLSLKFIEREDFIRDLSYSAESYCPVTHLLQQNVKVLVPLFLQL